SLVGIPAIMRLRSAECTSWQLAAALLITGGLATTVAFYVQNRVQRRTSPTRAAIVFATEPVFAAACTMVGWPDSAELRWTDGIGALLILAGLVVAELRFTPRNQAGTVPDV
ncbi:MAG: EamA family transporter, partial [Acidobacteriota bacterium]